MQTAKEKITSLSKY